MHHASSPPPAFRARLAQGHLLLSLLMGSTLVLTAVPATAQQAADVATARRLAGEGIQLFNTGDYAGALDRLERAQALFDAPTHLLFIARSQSKTGRLVESSETYRRLARVTLEPGAPAAFREAVALAPKELAELEPTIPLLTIAVDPPSVQGLSLSIDGVSVSAAVLGVERPVNPGVHAIQASAPGYRPANTEAKLEASGREAVSLRLEADRAGQVAAKPAPAADARTQQPSKARGAPAGDASSPPFIGFLVGLRLGGAITSGNVDTNRTMADYYGPGGSAQLNLGVRFPSLLRSLDLGVSGFIDGYALGPGSELDKLGGRVGTVTNAVLADQIGLALTASGKRHKAAPFGELGFALQKIQETRDFALNDGVGCQESTEWAGTALVFAGGVHFPLADWLTLSPHASGSIGQFTKQTFSGTCQDSIPKFDISIPAGNQKAHMLLGLGVGGEVWIGRD